MDGLFGVYMYTVKILRIHFFQLFLTLQTLERCFECLEFKTTLFQCCV